MQEAVRRRIASVGSTIVGTSRSSTRTSPGACMTTPRMVAVAASVVGGGVGGHVHHPAPLGTRRRKSLPRGVPAGHPSPAVGDLRSGRGQPSRGARVPHDPPCAAHPRRGRRAGRDEPARRRPAPQRGGGSRRGERGVLREARAGCDRWCVGVRARRRVARPAARRDRARAPARPRSRRRRHPHLGTPASSLGPTGGRRGPACSGRCRRSPTASRSSGTHGRTCWPSTTSVGRSTRP